MNIKRLGRTQLALDERAGFQPESYLAVALERVYRVAGLAMYRVLDRPESRSRVLGLVNRVDQAWRQGERTNRWAAFGRAVDRLKWAWLELLDADTTGERAGDAKGAGHDRA